MVTLSFPRVYLRYGLDNGYYVTDLHNSVFLNQQRYETILLNPLYTFTQYERYVKYHWFLYLVFSSHFFYVCRELLKYYLLPSSFCQPYFPLTWLPPDSTESGWFFTIQKQNTEYNNCNYVVMYKNYIKCVTMYKCGNILLLFAKPKNIC